MCMDYYNTLGVSRNTPIEEIKKSYRKLAMQHHPDRTNGDDTKFKQINEAYDTLGNPDKKRAYDMQFQQHRFNTGNFNDFFGQHSGFREPTYRQHKNRDIQLPYTLDIRECFTGKGATLRYGLPSGKSETVDVHIPPGCKDGDIVKIPGYGDDSIPNIPRGDLVLRVRVQTPKGWAIDNFDLLHSKEVSIFDLLIGADINVDTVDGKTLSLKIPKGTQSGTTFTVRNYGLPNNRTGKRGVLYIKVKGRVPNITDESVLETLRGIKNNIQ